MPAAMRGAGAVVIDPEDRRSCQALLLAAEAGRWGRATDKRTGELLYAIPSQRPDSLFHLASGTSCDCTDFRFHGHRQPCKHVLAVRLVELLRGASQVPPRRSAPRLRVLP
jgi:hypothetical protein